MNSNIPKFRTFQAQILFMNEMYKLPVAPYPTIQTVVNDELRKLREKNMAVPLEIVSVLEKRIQGFVATLRDELTEADDLFLKNGPLDFLVAMADLLADITVYCRSEAAKFGIPLEEVIDTVMQSNFSKLGEDGKPIIDANGKFLKGPNYWKPEAKIRELFISEYSAMQSSSTNEWTLANTGKKE
jgi:predicted HAD superfamily Cof-like phosphohydrolase